MRNMLVYFLLARKDLKDTLSSDLEQIFANNNGT
jgi:hypothetical protein